MMIINRNAVVMPYIYDTYHAITTTHPSSLQKLLLTSYMVVCPSSIQQTN